MILVSITTSTQVRLTFSYIISPSQEDIASSDTAANLSTVPTDLYQSREWSS